MLLRGRMVHRLRLGGMTLSFEERDERGHEFLPVKFSLCFLSLKAALLMVFWVSTTRRRRLLSL